MSDIRLQILNYLKAHPRKTSKQIAAGIHRPIDRVFGYMVKLYRNGKVKREKGAVSANYNHSIYIYWVEEKATECEYEHYRYFDYSSWVCPHAGGVVSQDVCRTICRYCPKEDWI